MRVLRMWAADGTWETDFSALFAQADTEGDPGRFVAADATIVPAQQQVAESPERGRAGEPTDHALGIQWLCRPPNCASGTRS
ncbi:hypothetical protein EDE04_7004 [Streptomyces sp. 2132.2]|uniref:hypothetical protein n=1 Tax=Streptomyces sp. 2132.2 TaxID=2485161 RepID=UPI000FB1921C|nr:hypothetical protein [Streptomyces sp. 2132.2]ROR00431.1 hypothetical protein EDE04_7004 [Streptomyces sp. 2132.2]